MAIGTGKRTSIVARGATAAAPLRADEVIE
jgi:hypothetical protein